MVVIVGAHGPVISQKIMSKLMLTIGVEISIQVVACILKRKDKVLISSRPMGKEFSGYYEFPGGKVKAREFLLESLKREILEELGVIINLERVIFLKSYKIVQIKRKLNLNFFVCTDWSGKIKSKEGQNINWVLVDELNGYEFLKSNKKFIDCLSYLVFPSTN